jgi:hypothetical protein
MLQHCCKSKTHFATLPRKSVVQSFTHASACNASQRKKSVAISAIATILGLLQHFSGVEIGSKFSSGWSI